MTTADEAAGRRRLRAQGNPFRLFVLAAGWGLATGAVIGAAVGTVAGALAVGLYGIGIIPAAALAGVLYGALAAAIPSVAGAAAVALTLQLRHPLPADLDAVRRDLAITFAVVVAGLNTVVLLAVLGTPEDGKYLLGVAGVLCLLDLVLWPLLMPVRRSLARAWTGEA